MKAAEAKSLSHPSSTSGEEADVDAAPAVAVAANAVEAQSLSHPSSTTGKEADMDATPAVDVAVEAQSLSHPSTTDGKEATMVAAAAVTERGEVSPSSTSTPDETPRKGGSGAKAGQSKRERRTAFDKNAVTALRVKDAGYDTPVAAMFVKSTAAAKHAQLALAQPLRDAEAGQRALTQAVADVTQRISRMLSLCRYLAVDIDAILATGGLTLNGLKARSVPQTVNAGFRLADHLMLAATAAPEALREEAKALFKATKACTAAVEGASTADRELAAARQALTLAIKESSDDYTLLAAEIRHTDARRGTQWAEKILLTETPKPRRKREPEKVDSDDPAELKEKKAVTG